MALSSQNYQNDNAKAIYDNLIQNGYNHNAAIAILSNISSESAFDPNKQQKLNNSQIGKGRGLFQHEVGGRFDTDPINLKSYAAKRGKDWNDLNTQLDFFHHEIKANPKFKTLKNDLNNMSLEDATKHFLTTYEGAGIPKTNARIKEANRLNKMFVPTIQKPMQYGKLSPDNPLSTILENPKSMQEQTQPQTYGKLSPDNPLAGILEGQQQQQSQTEKPKPPAASMKGLFQMISDMASGNTFGVNAPFTAPMGVGQALIRGGKKGIEDIGHEIGSLASDTRKNFIPALKYASAEPGKALTDVIAGGTNILDQLLNIPRNVPAISENLGLTAPGTGETSKDLPKFDITGLLPEAKTNESKYIRHLVTDLPGILPAGKAVLQAGKGALKYNPLKLENPIIAEQTNALEQQVLAHKQELEAANAAHAASKEALEQSQGLATAEPGVGVANPNVMIRKQREAKSQVKSLEEEATNLEKALEENKPVTPLTKEAEQAKAQLEQTQERHKNATETNEQIESSLGQAVNAHTDQGLRISRQLKPKLEANKAEISNEYNQHYKEAEKKNVVLPKEDTGKFKELMDQFYKLWKEDKAFTEEGDQLGAQIKALSQDEVIPGSKMIDIYKSVNGYIRDAYKKAYERGINKEAQAHWLDRAKALESKQEKIKASLKTAIGEDAFNKILATDKRWKTEVASLYKNPTYWKVMKGKRVKNAIENISEDIQGNDILQNLVKTDPEVLRNVIGQHYNPAKPSSFHEKAKGELMQEYLQHHPQIKNLIDLKSSNENVLLQEAKNLEQHEQHFENINKEAKTRNTELAAYEKHQADTKAKLNEARQKIADYDDKIAKLEEHRKVVTEKLKVEKYNLKKTLQLKSELSKMNEELKVLRKKRTDSEGLAIQMVRASYRLIKHHGAKFITGVFH